MTGRLAGDLSGPEGQLLGDALVLRGRAAIDAYALIRAGVAVHERRASADGIALPVRTRTVVEAARRADALARTSTDIADVRETPTSPVLSVGQVVDCKEVARMTGVGERQARRLVQQLGGCKTRSGWRIDRGLVLAHLDLEDTA